MSAAHTPTPWAVEQAPNTVADFHDIYGKSGSFDVLTCQATSEEDAAFIEIAVNSHDELLAALKALVQANDDVQTALCDGPDVPGFDPAALPSAQHRVTEAERVAIAAIAKAEGHPLQSRKE